MTLPRQKWLEMGSKMGSSHLFRQPKWPGNVFLKNTVFIQFLVAKRPIFKAFVTLEWPKWLAMGSKWAHFTCLGSPNGLESFLEKHIFHPFFVPKHPIFKAFWDFWRAKTGHHELKTRQKQLFWHSMWSTMIFERKFLLPPVDLGDPCCTHLFGVPLAACRSPLGIGTRV